MHPDSIKAIIFDMGGVFVQTMDKTPRTNLAERLHLSYDELSQIVFASETARHATVGAFDEKEHWVFLANHFGLSMDEMDEFWNEFWGGDLLDEQLFEYAKTLKSDYKVALLSNAWSGARDLLTRKFGFLDIFDVSVFSAEVKMAKPDEKFFNWMLNQLDIKPQEAIFVDDFIENIRAAQALGINAVHFLDTKQAITEINQILGL